MKWLKENLALVVLAFTAMTTVGGYFGIRNVRPVWVAEFDAVQEAQSRRDQWQDRALLRLTENQILRLTADIATASGADIEALIKARTELESQARWIKRRVEE